MLRLTTISMFILGLGCTALQDVDQFQPDFSCSVDIGLRNFFPHAQEPLSAADVSRSFELRERFAVYVVQERRPPGGDFRRFYMAQAFFDPLPAPDVDIHLPFAVDASETGDQLPATLELHADRQTIMSAIRDDIELDFFDISEIPNDHSWILPHACSAENTIFLHNSQFDQLAPATENALGLKVRPQRIAMSQAFVSNTIEVRVVRESSVGNQEVEQARAFYRRGASDRTIPLMVDGEMRSAIDIKEDAEIDVGGVLREDEDVTVITFVDRNGNGLYDADDFAVAVDLDLATVALRPCNDEGSPPPRFQACSDGDDVVVEVSLSDTSNPTLIEEAWWSFAE